MSDGDVIFPLRLTPFENSMYLDDAIGNSMVYCIRVQVAGVVDRSSLHAAVVAASIRHPLIRATIKSGFGRRRYWTVDHDSKVPLHFVDEAAYHYQVPKLDLTREPGVRVEVVQATDTALLQVFMHHAVADGVGTLQWIEHVLVEYALLSGGDPNKLKRPMLNATYLANRPGSPSGANRRSLSVRTAIHESWKFFRQVPQPLLSRRTRPLLSTERHEDFVGHQFTAEETRRLQVAATTSGASLNDLILCGVFATLAEWNARIRHDGIADTGDPWYRVTVPANMRRRDDGRTPAANIVSVAFLSRQKSVIANHKLLLDSIHRESRDIQPLRRGRIFLNSMAVLDSVPGLLEIMLRAPRCMATAVFTNLGDPSRRFTNKFPKDEKGMIVGNLRVISFQGVPPLRPKTNLSIAANSFGGRLMLNLIASPEWFDAEDANELLMMLTARLLSR